MHIFECLILTEIAVTSNAEFNMQIPMRTSKKAGKCFTCSTTALASALVEFWHILRLIPAVSPLTSSRPTPSALLQIPSPTRKEKPFKYRKKITSGESEIHRSMQQSSSSSQLHVYNTAIHATAYTITR